MVQLVVIVMGVLTILLVHEFGHLFVGQKLGFEAETLIVGAPFLCVTIRIKGLSIKLSPILLMGAVSFRPKSLDEQDASRDLAMILAGPFANVSFPLVLLLLYSWANNNLTGFYLFLRSLGEVAQTLLLFAWTVLTFQDVQGGFLLSLQRTLAYINIKPESGILWMIAVLLVLGFFFGLLNLIPLPGLDGGQIVLLLPGLLGFGKRTGKVTVMLNYWGAILFVAYTTFAFMIYFLQELF